MSTTARTPSISAVILWSSPCQFGTLCIVTPVISGPVVASDVATATFTRRGKVAMASFALPVKTVFSSVSSASSQTGVGMKPRQPVCVSMPAVSGRFAACAISVTVCSTSKPPIAPEAMCTRAPLSRAAVFTRS